MDSEVAIKSDVRDGCLWQSIDSSGKPARVVTRVDADKFNEFWLATVTGK